MTKVVVSAVKCKRCGWRLMDKEDKVIGKVQIKCVKCSAIWEVDLGSKDFKFLSE